MREKNYVECGITSNILRKTNVIRAGRSTFFRIYYHFTVRRVAERPTGWAYVATILFFSLAKPFGWR